MAALVERPDEIGEPEDGTKDHENELAGGPAGYVASLSVAPGSYGGCEGRGCCVVQDQPWTCVDYLFRSLHVPPMLDDRGVHAFYRVVRDIFAAEIVGIAKL